MTVPPVCRAALVLTLVFAPSTFASEPLPARLAAILDAPTYKASRWGILVVDAATHKVVYEGNADQLFAPASVTKLYSCAAALATLGADHRFETPVYRRGKVADGKLTGDLILVAQGDPTLGGRTRADGTLAFTDDDHIYASPTSRTAAVTDTNPLRGLEDLARQVKAAGIRAITGDVLIDDRLFEKARGSGSGPKVVSPIVVNDNVVDVLLRPAAEAGRPAAVRVRPETALVRIDAQVRTMDRGAALRVRVEQVGPNNFVVRGQVPVGAGEVVRIAPVDDPAAFARALFIEALRREGVDVSASPLRAPTAELPERDGYGRLTRVAMHRSAPLSEVLKVTLKVSHNLYASALPLLVGLKAGKRTLRDGMRQQGKVLAELGVDVKGISLETGAGGGNGDRVTPRATVALLASLAKRPDWATFKAALPVLGVDGTLARAVGPDSPARGKVWGKTGTYGDDDVLNGRTLVRAKTLAGTMTTARGQTLLFAVFVNDVLLPRGTQAASQGRVIGRVCEIIQQHAP
jgi:D-alanyl-D-alanine carboxypeptidase/D-alanyl-D-alanine-endopeptidase (penicillin-binding protein 4)